MNSSTDGEEPHLSAVDDRDIDLKVQRPQLIWAGRCQALIAPVSDAALPAHPKTGVFR